jgi:hypothetical protein
MIRLIFIMSPVFGRINVKPLLNACFETDDKLR